MTEVIVLLFNMFLICSVWIYENGIIFEIYMSIFSYNYEVYLIFLILTIFITNIVFNIFREFYYHKSTFYICKLKSFRLYLYSCKSNLHPQTTWILISFSYNYYNSMVRIIKNLNACINITSNSNKLNFKNKNLEHLLV